MYIDMDYKWTKVKGGVCFIGIVDLDIQQNKSNKNEIVENYTGKGFTGQGNIESVPANGYNSWKIGAKKGLEYAFSLVDNYWTVVINKIDGLSTDTNPTIVAYTVLRAFLDRVDFKLNVKEIEFLEKFVFDSWSKPYKEQIPDFFNLKFEDYND